MPDKHSYEIALTPSERTKYRHLGEYQFAVDISDDDYIIATVPWTVVKSIMHEITKHAKQIENERERFPRAR